MLRHAFTSNASLPGSRKAKRHIVVKEARLYVACYVALLLASIALQSTLLLWVWIVPLIVGQLFLRPYLYAEHTGCERTRSAFQNTRTTYTGMVMKWFAWNMPYHVEHHAYPSVPFHALPKLNQIVGEKIVYRGRSYRAVARETWAWFRRAQADAAGTSAAPDHQQVSTRLRACAGKISQIRRCSGRTGCHRSHHAGLPASRRRQCFRPAGRGVNW